MKSKKELHLLIGGIYHREKNIKIPIDIFYYIIEKYLDIYDIIIEIKPIFYDRSKFHVFYSPTSDISYKGIERCYKSRRGSYKCTLFENEYIKIKLNSVEFCKKAITMDICNWEFFIDIKLNPKYEKIILSWNFSYKNIPFSKEKVIIKNDICNYFVGSFDEGFDSQITDEKFETSDKLQIFFHPNTNQPYIGCYITKITELKFLFSIQFEILKAKIKPVPNILYDIELLDKKYFKEVCTIL